MAFPSKEINSQLVKCAAFGDFEAVASLLSAGADPRHDESHALRLAARNGHAECVRLLIPVSAPNANDSHALRWAAVNGHAECVKLLIPVSRSKVMNSYALGLAAVNGHAECVRMLIPVSDLKAHGFKPLCRAAFNGHAECVKLLIPASAPLIEIEGLVCSVIGGENPAILSIMMACEPNFLDGVDVPAALATAVAENRHELAAALRSITEREDIDSGLSEAPSASQKHSTKRL